MEVLATEIDGVLEVRPRIFGDARGFFLETFHADRYAEAGIDCAFVQDNLSRSPHGVLRGLHLQHPFAQDKLVYVLEGAVYDVAVDVRVGSPTFGQHVGREAGEGEGDVVQASGQVQHLEIHELHAALLGHPSHGFEGLLIHLRPASRVVLTGLPTPAAKVINGPGSESPESPAAALPPPERPYYVWRSCNRAERSRSCPSPR